MIKLRLEAVWRGFIAALLGILVSVILILPLVPALQRGENYVEGIGINALLVAGWILFIITILLFYLTQGSKMPSLTPEIRREK